MRRSKTSFPRLTWVACECGCGFEGEDDVVQFLIEEACMIGLDAAQAAEMEADLDEPEAQKPGTITDPAMQTAMEEAKRIHQIEFGSRAAV